MKILVINPGGTSTKIAVFEDEKELFKENITHTGEDLKGFPHVFDQFGYRKDIILETLKKAGFEIRTFAAVAGRGGLMNPIPGGTYTVNSRMVEDLRGAIHGEHPSNLGAVLAKEIGDEIGASSFVVDPVSVDELMPKARISGISDLERPSWFHALNHKAVARWAAERIGKKYEDCNLIIAHLGSGNSIVAHRKGQMVDGSGGRTNGPFSPERSGGLPTYPLVELCYSGKYTHAEMRRKIKGQGGMMSYVQDTDVKTIEEKALAGDEKYKNALDAMIYQTAQEIGKKAVVLKGQVDAILLTGGIAHSQYITGQIKDYVSFIAPVYVYPGEREMEALGTQSYYALIGKAEVFEV